MKLPANNLLTTRLIKRFPENQLIISQNERGMRMDQHEGHKRKLKGTDTRGLDLELLPIMVTLMIKE